MTHPYATVSEGSLNDKRGEKTSSVVCTVCLKERLAMLSLAGFTVSLRVRGSAGVGAQPTQPARGRTRRAGQRPLSDRRDDERVHSLSYNNSAMYRLRTAVGPWALAPTNTGREGRTAKL